MYEKGILLHLMQMVLKFEVVLHFHLHWHHVLKTVDNGINHGLLCFRILHYYPTTEKTGRKPCCIREQIIGIVMASERDFDNVACVWNCTP